MDGEAKGKKQKRPEEDVMSDTKNAEEDEEVQMEKFFALLKNVRAIRQAKRHKVHRSSWTPTFQWEDFAGMASSAKSSAAVPGVSKVGESGKEKKEEETSLDLRLGL